MEGHFVAGLLCFASGFLIASVIGDIKAAELHEKMMKKQTQIVKQLTVKNGSGID